MRKLLSIPFAVLLFFNSTIAQNSQTVNFTEGWKFKTGDSAEYSLPGLNDSDWEKIKIDRNWEDQSHDNYDGFAWYRIKILIPSTLKEGAFLKDSIKIFLGKIDDYDQAFINGKIFGVNGKNVRADYKSDENFIHESPIPWNKNRDYVLSVNDDRILWDEENVIAVRVYDQGGAGGMFSGGAYASMIDLNEYLKCDYAKTQLNLKGNIISKSFSLSNVSALYPIKGEFRIKASDKIDGKIYFEKSFGADLKPGGMQNYSYSFNGKNRPVSVKYIFEYSQSKAVTEFSEDAPYILTPKESPLPKINGAKVYGQRSNMPFLFAIAASGNRPMSFDAVNLPPGLKLDRKNGIISGKVAEAGIYKVGLTAKNKLGSAKSVLKIIIGNKIALTPPMGWNSWNVWGLTVDQNKVIASAKVYKEKGLINHGWSFINIDDGWEIPGRSPDLKRDAAGNILCNSKFPDMKALGDSIHALGLKFGIYSSPGTLTCGGYTASYQQEINDARSYASWGIDYLKYDWCSYDRIAKDHSLTELKKPYLVMRDALDNVDRDIVYSLCQYGMGKVWEWGESVGGNLWRTTGDITDTWESLKEIGFSQKVNAKFARPGAWNDPDMLIVGWVGWGPSLHPTRLTPDEQYTHISLWSLLSAPLLIGCDLTRLDEFTLNLLTNDEVIALNQDPLGKQAIQKYDKDGIQIWIKDLEDGSKAVGIFNLGTAAQKFSFNFSDFNLPSRLMVRDLWRQKDLGSFGGKFETAIASHGVTLIKLQTN